MTRRLAFDREWSQDELRAHLKAQGMKDENFIPGEIIPQGVKYVSSAPLTEADIRRAKELIASGTISVASIPSAQQSPGADHVDPATETCGEKEKE